MANGNEQKRKNAKESAENARTVVFGHEVSPRLLFLLGVRMGDVDEILMLYGISAVEFSQKMGQSKSWWEKRRSMYAADVARLSFLEKMMVVLDYPQAFLECAAVWIEKKSAVREGIRQYFAERQPPRAPDYDDDDDKTTNTSNNNTNEDTDDE
jgi:hypothetical protein